MENKFFSSIIAMLLSLLFVTIKRIAVSAVTSSRIFESEQSGSVRFGRIKAPAEEPALMWSG